MSRLLIDSGADLNASDDTGKAPLDYAMENGISFSNFRNDLKDYKSFVPFTFIGNKNLINLLVKKGAKSSIYAP